jgi:mitogen-activated protein kinase kinase kinase 4
MIWLELQAFLADRSLNEQDVYLCEERKNVASLLNEIANYKFNPSVGEKRGDSVDSGVGMAPAECQCLSMFCTNCSKIQNLAIEQVINILFYVNENLLATFFFAG